MPRGWLPDTFAEAVVNIKKTAAKKFRNLKLVTHIIALCLVHNQSTYDSLCLLK
jgi:hypothetical protein